MCPTLEQGGRRNRETRPSISFLPAEQPRLSVRGCMGLGGRFPPSPDKLARPLGWPRPGDPGDSFVGNCPKAQGLTAAGWLTGRSPWDPPCPCYEVPCPRSRGTGRARGSALASPSPPRPALPSHAGICTDVASPCSSCSAPGGAITFHTFSIYALGTI